MKNILIEQHAYAPELNKIHFKKGGFISAPNISSIKEARKKSLIKMPKKGLFVVAHSIYDDKKWGSLNKIVASGFCNSRIEAYKFTRQFKQKGGDLLNGDTLPPNKISLKFYYI